jgi:hypothetical protein
MTASPDNALFALSGMALLHERYAALLKTAPTKLLNEYAFS